MRDWVDFSKGLSVAVLHMGQVSTGSVPWMGRLTGSVWWVRLSGEQAAIAWAGKKPYFSSPSTFSILLDDYFKRFPIFSNLWDLLPHPTVGWWPCFLSHWEKNIHRLFLTSLLHTCGFSCSSLTSFLQFLWMSCLLLSWDQLLHLWKSCWC